MNEKYRRKRFYQKKIALYKSIFSFFIFSGLGIALLTAFYTFFSADVLTLVIDKYHLENAAGPVVFLSRMMSNQWFYIILGGLILVLAATFFTHRFAGPLYRFEISLDRMIKKDFDFDIKLRKNDECVTLAEKLNTLNDRMSSTLKTMMFLVDSMEKNNSRLQDMVNGREFDILADSMEMNHRLKRMLSGFNLK